MVWPLILGGIRVVLGGLAEGGAAVARGAGMAAEGAAGAGGRAAGAAESAEFSSVASDGKMFDKVMKHLEQQAIDEVNRIAIEIINDAMKHTPVGKHDEHGNKIGKHMKDEWVLQLLKSKDGQAIVENLSEHSIYVENGTNKMKGVHMLANAIAKAK